MTGPTDRKSSINSHGSLGPPYGGVVTHTSRREGSMV